MVTGAAGFIGSHLSEALVNEGHSVLGIDCFTDYYSKRSKIGHLSKLTKMKGFKLVEADISTVNLSPLLREVDYVFHLAAQPGVRASWGTSFSHYVKDNIVATQRLLEAAKGKSISRIVFASSSSIYGDSERLPTAEDAVPRPVSPYGATKLLCESLCHVYFRNYSLPIVMLRYFTVYGPRQRPDMAFNIFIGKIASGQKITVYGDGEQRRDFTFVDDTVAATVLASRATPGTVYNVGCGKSTSLNEVISIMESILGKGANVERKESAAGDVRSTSADTRRIKRDLGFEPKTTLVEGLRRQAASQLM